MRPKYLLMNISAAALLWGAIAFPALADFQTVLSNNLSGTVTTGNTFQSVAAQNVGRKGCTIQNPPSATEVLYVFFGPLASATTAKSIQLSAGAAVACQMPGGGTLADQVSVTAATSAHAFVALFQ